jgi:hypothetical protein
MPANTSIRKTVANIIILARFGFMNYPKKNQLKSAIIQHFIDFEGLMDEITRDTTSPKR